MKTRILVLVSCLLAFASHAQESKKELWKWTDANGVVHYSDVPGPGATKVDLMVTEPSSRLPAAAPPASASSTSSRPEAGPATNYSALEILEPADGASYFDADAAVNVRIRSAPSISPGDHLLLYLDGQLVDGMTNATDYIFSNLERGTHSLSAQIQDTTGNEKIRSRTVTFYFKPPTAIAPRAVGPNLKPPRPTPRGG